MSSIRLDKGFLLQRIKHYRFFFAVKYLHSDTKISCYCYCRLAVYMKIIFVRLIKKEVKQKIVAIYIYGKLCRTILTDKKIYKNADL